MLEARDYDELIRAANPLSGRRSDAEIDAAFTRLLRTLPAADAPRTRRWRSSRTRLTLAGSALAAAIVVAFVVSNLTPTSGAPGGVSSAWAKQVIARVTAVMSGSGHGILHIDDTIIETGRAARDSVHRSRIRSFRFDSWQQQTPPYTYWQTGHEGSEHTAMVITNRIERYDAATNTLVESERLARSEILLSEAFYNPGLQAVSYMALRVGHVSRKGSYGDLIARLLKAPGVAVDPHARVDGKTAISVTSSRGGAIFGTLYVQPATYRPLEYVIHEANQVIVTQEFSAYQTLPAGSVSPPNLQRLYPKAHVTIQRG